MRRWLLIGGRPPLAWVLGVPLLMMPAWWPLVRPGLWAAHDMFHHLFRLVDLDIVLRGGVFYARWLPDLGFFYGYPVLNFYAPMTYYITLFWRWIGTSYEVALKISYGLSFLVAAMGAYRWAREAWSPWASLWVAITYTYVPYHLANAYVRGALAEHWAQALAPWLFWWLTRLARTPPRGGWVVLGLLAAWLLVTHNLSAFLLFPAAGLYFLGWRWRGDNSPSRRWYGGALLATGLAFGLSAIYWLPAIVEVSWIRAGQVAFTVEEHVRQLAPFDALVSPYWVYRYYPRQGVPFEHPLSRWQVLMWFLSLGVVLVRRQRWTPPQRRWLWVSAILLAATVVLMSRLSAPVWSAFPALAFLQFPWRLQGIATLMTAAWAAPLAEVLIPRKEPNPRPVARGVVLTALFLGLWVATSMPYLPSERLTWPAADARPVEERDLVFWGMVQYDYLNGLWAREYGDPWLMEYLPVTVKVPREVFWLPETEKRPAEVSYTPPRRVQVIRQCPTAFELRVVAEEPTFLRWHQFWFPGWQAAVDGVPVKVEPSPELGLITFPVPAGEHRVRVWFGDTPVRRWGRWITLLSLGGLLVGLWRGGRRGVLIALVIGALVWGGLWAWQNARASTCERPEPAWALVGDRVAYLGCATRRHVASDPTRVVITVYWLALQPIAEDWKSFVHLLDPQGRTVAQHDAYPGENFSPTSRWEVGEIVPDTHTIVLDSEQRPWDRARIGLYRFSGQVENLPWQGPNGENASTAGIVRCRTP